MKIKKSRIGAPQAEEGLCAGPSLLQPIKISKYDLFVNNFFHISNIMINCQ